MPWGQAADNFWKSYKAENATEGLLNLSQMASDYLPVIPRRSDKRTSCAKDSARIFVMTLLR
jgi:hypothetical protein